MALTKRFIFARKLYGKFKLFRQGRVQLRYNLIDALHHAFSSTFRHKMAKRRSNRKVTKKYGAGFLSSRRTKQRQLAERDGYVCRHCHRPLRKGIASIDHIVRVADGGTNDLSNLQLLCLKCHRRKSQSEQRLDNEPRTTVADVINAQLQRQGITLPPDAS